MRIVGSGSATRPVHHNLPASIHPLLAGYPPHSAPILSAPVKSCLGHVPGFPVGAVVDRAPSPNPRAARGVRHRRGWRPRD